jgi:hypothetical protein
MELAGLAHFNALGFFAIAHKARFSLRRPRDTG